MTVPDCSIICGIVAIVLCVLLVGGSIGGGLAAAGYGIAISSDENYAGDMWCIIWSLISLCIGILQVVSNKRKGTVLMDLGGGNFCGICCGFGSFIGLIIVHSLHPRKIAIIFLI